MEATLGLSRKSRGSSSKKATSTTITHCQHRRRRFLLRRSNLFALEICSAAGVPGHGVVVDCEWIVNRATADYFRGGLPTYLERKQRIHRQKKVYRIRFYSYSIDDKASWIRATTWLAVGRDSGANAQHSNNTSVMLCGYPATLVTSGRNPFRIFAGSSWRSTY